MRACIVARGADNNHQHEWGRCFATGLRRHGWTADVTQEPFKAELLVVWGCRNRAAIDPQLKAGGEVCVLERGYLGDRFHWTSVSFGGELNGRAEFRGVKGDVSRFDRHFGHMMRPWHRKDGYALLVGQVAGDWSLQPVGGDLAGWYRETARALKSAGHDVVFRPHPGTIKRGTPIHCPPGARVIGGTLQEALDGASVVVTFNSNTGVESALAGVPTITFDRGSMAWSVSSHSVGEALVTPYRMTWAAALAWCQWTLDEIASGECWEAVKG